MNPDLAPLTWAALPAAGLVLFTLYWASRQPLQPRWRDSGDVSTIVQHSVRVPSGIEREALWRGRYALVRELGEVREYVTLSKPRVKV